MNDNLKVVNNTCNNFKLSLKESKTKSDDPHTYNRHDSEASSGFFSRVKRIVRHSQ